MANFEAIFNDSYARVLSMDGDSDLFFSKFYEKFMSTSPEVRDKFKNTDMKRQKKMLKLALYQMLSFFMHKKSADYMQGIAESHAKKDKDIAPHLYELWLDSLVDTVKELDPKFDPDVGLAWKSVMSMGITYMKDRYDRDKAAPSS